MTTGLLWQIETRDDGSVVAAAEMADLDGGPDFPECRVYWGSHGCDLWRGHIGPCICLTCWDEDDNEGYVGSWPYYGPETRFYGEDVTARGLPEGAS